MFKSRPTIKRGRSGPAAGGILARTVTNSFELVLQSANRNSKDPDLHHIVLVKKHTTQELLSTAHQKEKHRHSPLTTKA
jgi:hypothetical protein